MKNLSSVSRGCAPFRVVSLFIVFLLFTTFSNAQPSEITSGLIGQNYWMPSWANNGKLEQVWPKVGDMQPEIIRIGGNHYREYMGTAKHEEMLTAIESIGAVPLVQLSERWTSSERYELLYYIKNSSHTVKYWAINNEEDEDNPVSAFDVPAAIQSHKTIAQEIRNVFPNAIISGPAFKRWDPSELYIHTQFLAGILDAKDNAGKYILNIYDMHSYTSSFTSTGTALMDLSTFKYRLTNNILNVIDAANANRATADKVSWMFSEFNIVYNNVNDLWINGTQYPSPSTHKAYSFYAGQYFAQMYGYGIEKGAFAMIPWSIHESSGDRSALDLGIFDESPGFKGRSTYYHTQMLATNLKDNFAAYTTSKTDVEIVSLSDNSGVTVMVMNTGNNSYNMALRLDTQTPSGNSLNITVNANINKEEFDTIDPTSTKTYVFDASGNLLKKITYTKANADSQSAPTTTLYSNPPVVSFNTPTDYSTIDEGQTLTVQVAAEHTSGIDNVTLYLNDDIVRKENIATYDWGSNDPLLVNMSAGTYKLKAIATAKSGATAETTITVTVNSLSNAPANGSVIWLQAKSNNSYVSSDTNLYYTGLMVANRTSVSGWEKFTVETISGDNIRLKSASTGKYVRVATWNSGKLDGYGDADNYTSFLWVTNTDGSISIKANANNMYVSADLNEADTRLIANRTAIGGWEKFDWGYTTANKAAMVQTEAAPSVYPNPTSSSFTIDLNGMNDADISIYSFSGQLMFQSKTTENLHLSKDDLSSTGMYLIKIVDENNKIYTQKLMVK